MVHHVLDQIVDTLKRENAFQFQRDGSGIFRLARGAQISDIPASAVIKPARGAQISDIPASAVIKIELVAN